jgi:hypothetical protein
MQRARSRLAGHLMEHKLPSLCGRQALSLFHFSRLKARWAHRQECLCSGSAGRRPTKNARPRNTSGIIDLINRLLASAPILC